jgi:two-component system, NarL family, sensor histidine kinase DesK
MARRRPRPAAGGGGVTIATATVDPAWGARRHVRWFLVALHLPLLAGPPVFTIAGYQGRAPGSPLVVVPLAGAVAGLQLRHSLAAARGERPPHWPSTLVVLAAVVYGPIPWFTWNWAATQWCVMASAAMLLRGRLATAAVAAPLVVTATIDGILSATARGEPLPRAIWIFVYWLVAQGVIVGAIVGAAQLVRAVDEMDVARAELAESAVGRERIRVSRDLHDLLGQSLSAISLEGDLALLTLASEPGVAEAEIRSLTNVARTTLRDIRNVTHGEHAASLAAEARGAAVLLDAASIDARIDIRVDADPHGLAAPIDEVLAWATREAVTNVLRHSQARWCSIVATRHDGLVRLEIVNDGAGLPRPPGNGLTGLAERAEPLGGTMSAGPSPDGLFRLVVELPESAA